MRNIRKHTCLEEKTLSCIPYFKILNGIIWSKLQDANANAYCQRILYYTTNYIHKYIANNTHLKMQMGLSTSIYFSAN